MAFANRGDLANIRKFDLSVIAWPEVEHAIGMRVRDARSAFPNVKLFNRVTRRGTPHRAMNGPA